MSSYVIAILRRRDDLPDTKPSLGSRVSGSSTKLRYIAVSRTVRLTPPSTRRGHGVGPRPPDSSRPRDGFRPKRPPLDAGSRVHPPPSFPCASAKMPAATHAAEPPLDPP